VEIVTPTAKVRGAPTEEGGGALTAELALPSKIFATMQMTLGLALGLAAWAHVV
jgi:hypothetical protein